MQKKISYDALQTYAHYFMDFIPYTFTHPKRCQVMLSNVLKTYHLSVYVSAVRSSSNWHNTMFVDIFFYRSSL